MESNLGGISGQTWTPTSDLRETNNEFVLTAELPGVKKEDISIELSNGLLTISGERKKEKREGEEGKWHRAERSYGYFRRTLRVPETMKEEDVKATFENGVLEVHFPKARPSIQGQERKRITVA